MPLKIDCEVLEDRGLQSFQKDGDVVEFRNALIRYESRVFRIRVKKDVDLRPFAESGEVARLSLELTAGNDLKAGVRVIAVE